MTTCNNTKKLSYEAPTIKIVTFQVERGFAASQPEQSSNLVNEMVRFNESQSGSCFERYQEKNYTW